MIAASSASAATWVGIAAVTVGFFLTTLAALIAYIFADVRKQLTIVSRQLEGVMSTIGPLMWRTIAIEDWLESRFDYKVPRDIGWTERAK